MRIKQPNEAPAYFKPEELQELQEVLQAAPGIYVNSCPVCGTDPEVQFTFYGTVLARLVCPDCGATAFGGSSGTNILGHRRTIIDCVTRAVHTWNTHPEDIRTCRGSKAPKISLENHSHS